MQLWKLQLLGETSLMRNNERVVRFPAEKVRLLLAYLAVHPNSVHTREVLADMFWPQSYADAARASLRQAIASLRRILEPPQVPAGTVLLADRFHVRLSPEAIQTDISRWHSALDRARKAGSLAERRRGLDEALRGYGGEFLPGAYDDWVLDLRRHLQDEYIHALLDLAAAKEEGFDYSGAIECVQRLLRTEPLQDEANERLIRLLALQGRLGSARKHYNLYCRMLYSELNESPDQKLVAMYSELGSLARAKSQSQERLQIHSVDVEAPSPTPEPPNLPLVLTRFVGREDDICLLTLWLNSPDVRLITVTGLGGIGKTRLAIETARRATRFAHAITFVSLAGTHSPDLILPTLANSLGLSALNLTDPGATIIETFGSKSHLVIFDNFEEIGIRGVDVVMDLLRRAPALTCLLTSRHALNVAGENELALAPLPVPKLKTAPTQLISNPAVQLFVERMRARRPDFQVTRHNAAAVAELCVGLEGLPLAIELAAGWGRDMTPRQMLEALNQRFELLVSRQKGVEPRHRSLQAVLESSYLSLPVPAQRLLARLAVFQGAWTNEMAEYICLHDDQTASVIDLLREIRDHSLIKSQETDSGLRYSMLDSVRDFASQQMSEYESRETASRLAAYLLDRLEALQTSYSDGEAMTKAVHWTEEQHDNLRAALQWCVESAPNTGIEICSRLWYFWFLRGYSREGLVWLSTFLAITVSAGTTPARARALNGAGNLSGSLGDYKQCEEFFEQGLLMQTEMNNKPGMASLLNNLGLLKRQTGDLSGSRRLNEASLAIWEEIGDAWGIAGGLLNLAEAAYLESDYASAHRLAVDARDRFRAQGNRVSEHMAHYSVAVALHCLGDTATARRYCLECIAAFRDLSDVAHLSEALCFMVTIEIEETDFEAARTWLVECLQCARDIGSKVTMAKALAALAFLDAKQNHLESATLIAGAVDAYVTKFPTARTPEIHKMLTGATEIIDGAGHRMPTELSSRITLDEAVTEALQRNQHVTEQPGCK